MGSVSRAVIGLIISCMKDKSCAFPLTLDHRVGCKLRALQHTHTQGANITTQHWRRKVSCVLDHVT